MTGIIVLLAQKTGQDSTWQFFFEGHLVSLMGWSLVTLWKVQDQLVPDELLWQSLTDGWRNGSVSDWRELMQKGACVKTWKQQEDDP